MVLNNNWVDAQEYSFQSNFMPLRKGQMHYIDEGEGDVVLFVHGNPSWSFYFRKIIKEVSRFHRCIAIDQLGFGLSEKSDQWRHSPSEHTEHLEEFIKKLGINKFSMVMHDLGGPIGLSYALKYPENVDRLVIGSSWMWDMSNDIRIQIMSRLLGGFIGKFFAVRHNLIAKSIYRKVFISDVSDNVYRHYHMHLSEPGQRHVTWLFPKYLISEKDWLQSLWERRGAISYKKALLVRGTKDLTLDEKHFRKWQSVFYDSKVVKFQHSGYCPEEDEPDKFNRELLSFLGNSI